MRGWRRTAAIAAVVIMGAVLEAGPAAAQGRGLPPLIDREILFGDPDIASAQLSPDGTHIAFVRPFNGTRNVWVKKTEEPFSSAKPVTAETTRPIAGYLWSRDGKYILYVRDQGGDENFNVYAVNPAEAPPEGAQVPTSRNLTNLPKVRAQLIAVPKSEPDVIYIGLNDRDPAWHDLYRLKISTGERELVRQNTERFTGHIFDRKDQLRLVTRSAPNGDTEILRVDAQGMTKIYSCSVLESCNPAGFHPDGKRVYLITNHGDQDLAQLELLDVESGRTERVESDPEKRVDIGGVIVSNVTYELLGTVYVDARVRLYWRDAKAKADYEFLKSKFPKGEISFASTTADESKVLIAVRADTEPGDFHLFDRQTRKLTPQFRLFDNLPREALTEMRPIEYASSDGLKIPAYLSLPKGVGEKNLPLLVLPHGGPWARDGWGYSPYTQFFTNRGFAVLQPNFRGSVGYGKRFLNAGNGQWGQLMQDDITWGVKHLVSTGIADPKRVAIMGASYGGYATLAGLAFTPDVYAAGVSYVGPSNLITLLNAIPSYWEPIRKFLYTRMGDPGTPEGKALLERQSPLHAASKIKAPLMVIQGANDPRVSQHESDQIVVALRDRKFPVEYYVAPDEGHGFAKPVNNIAVLAAAEKFFAKHISGVRYQESMQPEVAKRLAELTVDPATVKLAQQTDPASVAPAKPVRALQPAKRQYKGVLSVAGQQIDLTITHEIKRADDGWSVTESVTAPQGIGTDEATLAADTLTVQKRSITQGPIRINFAVQNGKAEGQVDFNGQVSPLSIDLNGGEVFGDGPAAAAVIATLPLAEGYVTTLRGLSLLTRQVRVIELKVTGSERVKVSAGEFDSFRVELSAPDGLKGTLWITKDTFVPVKGTTSAPEMQGGSLTAELI